MANTWVAQIYSSEISSWEYPYILALNGKDSKIYSRENKKRDALEVETVQRKEGGWGAEGDDDVRWRFTT